MVACQLEGPQDWGRGIMIAVITAIAILLLLRSVLHCYYCSYYYYHYLYYYNVVSMTVYEKCRWRRRKSPTSPTEEDKYSSMLDQQLLWKIFGLSIQASFERWIPSFLPTSLPFNADSFNGHGATYRQL